MNFVLYFEPWALSFRAKEQSLANSPVPHSRPGNLSPAARYSQYLALQMGHTLLHAYRDLVFVRWHMSWCLVHKELLPFQSGRVLVIAPMDYCALAASRLRTVFLALKLATLAVWPIATSARAVIQACGPCSLPQLR
jgi:hypothetical protein